MLTYHKEKPFRGVYPHVPDAYEDRSKVENLNNDYCILKEEIDKLQNANDEMFKVLQILKEKRVDLCELIGEFEWEDGLETYNNNPRYQKLTQEEYNLLKELFSE